MPLWNILTPVGAFTADQRKAFVMDITAKYVDHVARQLETPELREWHIDETPLDLWRTQGLIPPPAFSDMEKLWAKENRPIPYEVATS